MLKLLEGAEVEVPIGANSKNAMVPLATVNTKNILFICGGAFPDLEEIIKQLFSENYEISSDFVEAKSIAVVASIILDEVREGNQ